MYAISSLVFGHILTPNLKALDVLLSIDQNDSETPVPYIQFVFKYLWKMDGMNEWSRLCYLSFHLHLSLHLHIEHNNLLDTPQWNHWAALNTQLKKLELASHQVNITISSSKLIPDGVIERLEGNLSCLKELGNLFIKLEQMA